ncbi:MAG: GxxExxY protein [Planctomycetes bacterium]|nr:GxxExxY protein [Planctomycetota bacterium]
MYEPIPKETERIAGLVIEAAFRVHRALGPGLLESVYETCLCHELSKMGVSFQRQSELPITYDGQKLKSGLRIDVFAADCVIVELKAVEKIIPLFEAQTLTYLKMTKQRLGLLINFNVTLLKDGIKRIVL